MKVKCIQSNGMDITEGKIYEGLPTTISERDKFVCIKNDRGEITDYFKTRFVVLDEKENENASG
jgi:hypothetical protein